eukprot:6675245-Pyramimonas_sp.AAC.1
MSGSSQWRNVLDDLLNLGADPSLAKLPLGVAKSQSASPPHVRVQQLKVAIDADAPIDVREEPHRPLEELHEARLGEVQLVQAKRRR